MTPKSVTKTILLASSDLATTFAVQTGLQLVVNKIAPNLTEWDEEWTNKQKALRAAKLIGVTLGIAVAAGATATVVHSLIDENLWNNDEEVQLIEN